jgi:hypothetical protein
VIPDQRPRHARGARLRQAAILFDTSAARWRYELTGDNTEIRDLLPEQLAALAPLWPEGSPQRTQIERRIAKLTAIPQETAHVR